MVAVEMEMPDWVSMMQCACGHPAKSHKLRNPDYPMGHDVIGTCKDCKPYSHMDMKGCDGFKPRTFADAVKLQKALGLPESVPDLPMEERAETVGEMEAVQDDEYRELVDAPDLGETVRRNLAVGNQKTPHGIGREITPLVIADMEERSAFGKEKYGEPLTAFNGRDTLMDTYQEGLDLVVYLRQMIEERDGDRPTASDLQKKFPNAGPIDGP